MAEVAKRAVTRLPREQRLHEIEDAAREMFCLRGYAGTTVADIAARAGVAEGTVYTFFPTKKDLVVRVVELWYDQMLDGFNRNLPGVTGARNRIRFIIRQHLLSLHDNPALARLCCNEVRNDGDYYQGALYKLNRRYTQVFIEVFRQGVESGEFRRGISAGLLRDLVFGGIDHHISGFLYGRATLDVDRSTEMLVDLVLAAIGTRDVDNAAPITARLDRVVERLEAVADQMRIPQ
jgi:AcrR family transcriptional regulator